MLLKISQNSQENTSVEVHFLIKFQTWGLQLYLKRDSNTGVFLWILWNLSEYFFHIRPLVAASASKKRFMCKNRQKENTDLLNPSFSIALIADLCNGYNQYINYVSSIRFHEGIQAIFCTEARTVTSAIINKN